ncbi:MAG: methyltransferase domain-containing protein [Candidatus Omnitrophota bacterium]
MDKQKRIKLYPGIYLADYGFEKNAVASRQRIALETLQQKKPVIVVEVGCGADLLYKKALKARLSIKQWIIVEPSAKFAQVAKRSAQKKIPLFVIQNFLEDAAQDIREITHGPIDFIVCTGLLHEVPNPDELLRAARSLLSRKGTIHINVSNGNSLHRRLAKAMGLIKDVKAFSRRNKQLMQHHVFDLRSLTNLVISQGFAIAGSGGCLLKPFSNSQMDSIKKVLTAPVMEGLFILGRKYPELANEIFINARLR